MQERSQTPMSNNYYNAVSVLYHSLQEAQTCSIYIRDAQQSGLTQAEQFFRDVQQDASRHAQRAQELVNQMSQNVSQQAGSTQYQRGQQTQQ